MKTTNFYILIAMLFFASANCIDLIPSDLSNGNSAMTITTQIASGTQAKMNTANNDLQIDSARIHVRNLKLHATRDADSLDFNTGSFVMTLDPADPVREIAITEIPFGRYDKVSFRIHRPAYGEIPADPAFVQGENGDHRYSLIVNGTYQGQAFEFRSRRSFTQKIELSPDLVIDENSPASMNVTLEVDLNSWFTDEYGDTIDPFSDEAYEEIEDAIKRSFRAFKDNDQDGHDDDEGEDNGEDDDHDRGDDDDEKDDDNKNGNDDNEYEITKDFVNTGVTSGAKGYLELDVDEDYTEFEVEVYDLEAGTYELHVGGEKVADLVVEKDEDDEYTEGELNFRDPVKGDYLELTFDPEGKEIEIIRNNVVYLQATL